MSLVAGVDSSTQSTKVVVVDADTVVGYLTPGIIAELKSFYAAKARSGSPSSS